MVSLDHLYLCETESLSATRSDTHSLWEAGSLGWEISATMDYLFIADVPEGGLTLVG